MSRAWISFAAPATPPDPQVNLFFDVPSPPSTRFPLEPCLFSDRQVRRGDLQTNDLMGGQVDLFFDAPRPPSTRFSLEPCVFSHSQVTHGDLQNHDLMGGQVDLF